MGGSPLPQEQFFPISGVRIVFDPEGHPTLQTAVGLSPGDSLSGEALTRTWFQFSCSDHSFLFRPLALSIRFGPVSDCFAAILSLP